MDKALSDYHFIARMVVGNTNPNKLLTEEESKKQMNKLNFALEHGGNILGIEKNFYVLNLGEHQVVLQYLTYHLGFIRKPYWYKED